MVPIAQSYVSSIPFNRRCSVTLQVRRLVPLFLLPVSLLPYSVMNQYFLQSPVIIVIPTYNERENLEPLISAIFDLGLNLRVVVVDDDSADGTGELANQLAQQFKSQIHVIHRKGKKGRGTAGIVGLKYALTQDVSYIFEMDADFSHPPRFISDFLTHIRECDIVVGSRYISGGKFIAPFSKILLSRLINILNRFLLKLDIKDTSGGYKCYRKEVLEALDLNSLISNGYSIGAEILYKSHLLGFKIKEIPIEFRERQRGQTKSSLKIKFEYLISIFRLRKVHKL